MGASQDCTEPSMQGLPGDLDSPHALRVLLQACNTLSYPIFIHDLEYRILRANAAYVKCAGMSYAEVLGRPYWQVFPRTDGPIPSCARALANGMDEQLEDILTDDDQVYRSRALAVRDDAGAYLYSLHILEDITEFRRAQEALRREKAMSDATIASAPGIFFVVDAAGHFIRWNGHLSDMTGLSARSLRQATALSAVYPEDRAMVAARIKEAFSAGHAEVEARLRTRTKGVRHYALTAQRFTVGSQRYLAGFGVDVTDLKRARDRLQHLATHDRLTGLPNRNLFFDRLQHGLDRAARNGASLGVLFVDLDNFKVINDSFGHEMGDILLVQMAQKLRECTRREDTVSRLAGDEFTVIAEDLGNSPGQVLAGTAERIIEAVAAPFLLGGREAFLSASVGIAVYPRDGTDVSGLLKSADTAMYNAKRVGKNTYQFFTTEMNAHAAERRALEYELRGACARNELFLEYQPLLDVRSSRIESVEALLRWRHPQRGVLLPDHFVPLAESTGLIVPIGDWVLQTVCRQLRTWSEMGLKGVRVAVNLSARQFRREGLADAINGVMRENAISGPSLEFELTESSVMEDAESAAEILDQLKAMGVRLAIDDFGVGYSSLQYLKRFPIDNLKIDGNFIRDLATDTEDQAIVSAIITMGHSMRLDVVAEGVETRQQLEFLRSNGCDLVQGNYINVPLPAQRATGLFTPA